MCHVLVADDEPHIGRIIQFKLDKDTDVAAQEVRDKMSTIMPRLPLQPDTVRLRSRPSGTSGSG